MDVETGGADLCPADANDRDNIHSSHIRSSGAHWYWGIQYCGNYE
jgi:hypothetical protein